MNYIQQLQQQLKRKAKRKARIDKMRAKGMTDAQIADVLKVSRARVQYIRTKT